MVQTPSATLLENAPRYTSYPTAPHFHAGIGGSDFAAWLSAVHPGEVVSLYLHIPFCDQLCWFCACNTKHTTRYHVVETYLKSLHAEIETVGRRLGRQPRVGAIHYGGGSPTMLRPEDLVGLDAALRRNFRVLDDAEISVEIDPRDMDTERYLALKEIGTTRASIGVQDFDEKVQGAINRHQSFEMTRDVVDAVRAHGARSVNLDLLYGLPHQTIDSLHSTITQSLTLQPDRIALFGYAHVPWFKKQQTMIRQEWLPDAAERLQQSATARDLVIAEGYDAIGLDHFSLPSDSLALAARAGTLRRNFQGYTTDRAATLIGLGASAISQFPQGYLQNAPSTPQYQRLIGELNLATEKGIALTLDDRVRGWVIERLMCDFAFTSLDAHLAYGHAARDVIKEAQQIAREDVHGHVTWNDEAFRVTQAGRPYVRSIAARFDAYLATGQARHSLAV